MRAKLDPADAYLVLEDYQRSEYACVLTMLPGKKSLAHGTRSMALRLEQDGEVEPVELRLLNDGRWELSTNVDVAGVQEDK